MKKVVAVVAALSCVLMIAGCKKKDAGAAAEKTQKVYTMQIGHAQPVDNPRHISLEAFKKIVNSL